MCLKKSIFVGCLCFVNMYAMESKESEKITPVPLSKKSSVYVQYIKNGSTDFNKGNLKKVFSSYKMKYGGNCNIFNLLSMFVVDQDPVSMKTLLEVYAERNGGMKELAECGSDAYGTTIMHHIMEHINKEKFLPLLECMIIILNKHPQLIQYTDKNSRIPLWFFKQNTRFKDNDIETTIINMISKAYNDTNMQRSHILSQCRLLYFIAKQDLDSIKTELRYYNQEQGFLVHRLEINDQQQTLAHFIVRQINEQNFDTCFAILQFLLKNQPNLDVKYDTEELGGKTPLDYLKKVLLVSNPKLINAAQLKRVTALLNDEPTGGSCVCFSKK